MPSEQATWLIAVPDDSDAIGIQQKLTSKLSQAKASGTVVAELKIPPLKVSYNLLNTLAFERLTMDSHPADRNARPSHHPIRRTTQTRLLLHPDRREDRGHATEPPQQRPRSIGAARESG